MTEPLADRLVRLHLEDFSLTDLTPSSNRYFLLNGEFDFAVSPDGQTVAYTANSTPPPFRDPPNNDLYLVSTDGRGEPVNLTTDNPYADEHPVFSKDGKYLYFTRNLYEDSNGEFDKLYRHDFDKVGNRPLSEGLDLSFLTFESSPDGRTLYYLAEDRGMVGLFSMSPSGKNNTRLTNQGTISALSVGNEAIVYLHETFQRPAELFAYDRKLGQVRQLTNFNQKELEPLRLGQVESLECVGAGGDTVQMWLIHPPTVEPGKKYPLVQLLHGGPHTMVRDAFSFRWNAHLFAAGGYFVCWVNRHGSTGFGEAYSRSILGEWGKKPLEDLMRATDFLLEKYPIDENRLAAAGASYGGYFASWILGNTTRFRCIVNHAGVYSFSAQFGSDFTYHRAGSYGGSPWDHPEAMNRYNPATLSAQFQTPMLITHGELDYRVPVGHALELYGILQARGLPSKLIIYPNENHWILTPQNSLHWYTEVREWFSRYLGGEKLLLPVLEEQEKE